MQRTTQHHRRPPGGGGFTLIEILVVISVLVAIIALSVAVYANMMETARRAATMVTIAKVDRLLQQQIAAWSREHIGSDLVEQRAAVYSDPRLANTVRYRLLQAGAPGGEALALKDYYRLHFAQTKEDAYGFDQTKETRDDVAIYLDWIKKNKQSIADSSELLYIALTQGRFRGAAPSDAGNFIGRELADTDDDTLLELVDGWGNPLRFYRWPTRLLHPFGFVGTTMTAAVDAQASTTTLPVSDGQAFQRVLTDLGATGKVHVVVGREIMRLTGANATSLTVERGSQSTNREIHPSGALVKLAAFADIVSMLFGSLNSSAVVHDADDPRGDLSSGVLNNSDMTIGDALTDLEAYFHTLDSFHTPLIVSAGSDGILGLAEPNQTVDPAMDDPGWNPNDPLNVSATDNQWRWGRLAQPETNGGTNFSIILDPLNSTLNDNLTNQMEGLGN